MDHRAEAYILSLENDQRSIALLIREMIFALVPDVQEQFKYAVPYYSNPKPLCYLVQRKNGVDIGFIQGIKLADTEGILEDRGTKQVRHVRIAKLEDFPHEPLQGLFEQAVKINQTR